MNDLDKILDFLIKHFNKERNVLMPNVMSIQKDLFPYYNTDQVISLLNQIHNNRPDILKYKRTNSGDLIQITGLTESFLNQGGFTKIEENQNIEFKKKKKKENLEYEKTKIDLELSKKILEEFPKTKWFARIGFIIGIVLMLKELYILIWK